MKNKKLSWFLLPLVLGIWGAIGWQVYAAMKGDDAMAVNDIITGPIAETHSVIHDTFTLLLDYRDPFLDKSIKKAPPISTNRNNTAPKNSEPVVAKVQWPAISYSGLVRQPNSDRMVGFLSVNGKTYFVKSGDVIDPISVGKITRDSVEIAMGDERRYFRK